MDTSVYASVLVSDYFLVLEIVIEKLCKVDVILGNKAARDVLREDIQVDPLTKEGVEPKVALVRALDNVRLST